MSRVPKYDLRVDPSRSMRDITAEVEGLLAGLEETSRRGGALLASELIAQVVGRDPGFRGSSVALRIQLRGDTVRMEASGPEGSSRPRSAVDPLADWGRFVLDRLAHRWGVGGEPQRAIWAEIERGR
jgi:hypothetical protein